MIDKNNGPSAVGRQMPRRPRLSWTVAVLVPLLAAGCATQPLPAGDAESAARQPDLPLAAMPCKQLTPEQHAARLGISPKSLARVITNTGYTREALCDIPGPAVASLAKQLRDAYKADANGMREYFRAHLLDGNGEVRVDWLDRALTARAMMIPMQKGAKLGGISPGAWQHLGPMNEVGGRVRAVAIDPDQPTRVWAGTASGGIWRSENSGASWVPNDPQSAAFSITDLAIDPNDHNRMYAATGEFWSNVGIWKSTDRGNTWSQLPNTKPGNWVPRVGTATKSNWGRANAIGVLPADSNVLVVGAEAGLFVSNDGGDTWRNVLKERSPSNLRGIAVTMHPTKARAVVVALSRGMVAVGSDVGLPSESWQEVQVAGADANSDMMAVAIAKSSGRIYAAGAANRGTLYLSDDGGTTWRMASNNAYCGSQCWYNNALWVDPTNDKRVVLGGVELYRSEDGGTSWSRILNGATRNGVPSANHVDFHAFAAHPGYNGSTQKSFFVGNDGGIYQTDDITAPAVDNNQPIGSQPNAMYWRNLNNGLGAFQFYSVYSTTTGSVIGGGSQDNGSRKFGGGTSWTVIAGGDGGQGGVPEAGTPIFGSYQNMMLWRAPYDASRNWADVICDGITEAAAWSRYEWNAATSSWDSKLVCGVAGQSAQSLFIVPLVLDRSTGKRLYTGGQSVWVTDDATASPVKWRILKAARPKPTTFDGPTSVPRVSSIAVAPSNPQIVWIGYDDGQVFATNDALATSPTWRQVFAAYNRWGGIRSIHIAGDDPSRVMISRSAARTGVLFITHDAGVSWSGLESTLFDVGVATITEHPTRPGQLFAGTGAGIYASEDGGATWSASNDGPAAVPVEMLAWTQGNTLLAATHGRGMWQATVPATGQGGYVDTGWWWNPQESGRGYFIERRGEKLFMGGFIYNADGRPTWFVATGPITRNASGKLSFDAEMQTYSGGQTLTSNFRPPVTGTPLGRVTLSFDTATKATMTLAGVNVPIQRFQFNAGGLQSQDARGVRPHTGWWWNPAESGRGYALEIQGDSMFGVVFTYNDAGQPVWYLSTGKMADTFMLIYSGQWVEFRGGQTLGGPYQNPTQTPGSIASLNIDFVKLNPPNAQGVINAEFHPRYGTLRSGSGSTTIERFVF